MGARPFLVTIGITLVNAVVSLAFAIQAAVADHGESIALNGVGRSLVFLFLAIAVGIARTPWGAVLVAGALAVVQAFDAVVGAIAGDPPRTGPRSSSPSSRGWRRCGSRRGCAAGRPTHHHTVIAAAAPSSTSHGSATPMPTSTAAQTATNARHPVIRPDQKSPGAAAGA